MDDVENDFSQPVRKGAELEYGALRAELLKRIELRQSLISTTLTFAGVFLGFGLQNRSVALIFPLLTVFLGLLWANNDIRFKQIGKYLQDVEKLLPGAGWETYYRREGRYQTLVAGISLSVLAPAGTFLATSLMAIGIGLSQFSYALIDWVLLVVDIISALIIVFLLKYVGQKDKHFRL